MAKGKAYNQVAKQQSGKKSLSSSNKNSSTASPAQALQTSTKGSKTKNQTNLGKLYKN